MQFICSKQYSESFLFLSTNLFEFYTDSIGQKQLPLKENIKKRVGKLPYFCYILLTHTLSIYRLDEDIEMTVCEPYSLHQSKPTDESKVIYDECQLSTTDITGTSVYESI